MSSHKQASGSVERQEVGEARTSCQLCGRRRNRQYQAEHHERGLLPRPTGILVVYSFLEGTADQYMTRAVTTVARQTTMRELEALFEKHDFNSFPVVENENMLGIVTKFDFLRAFAFTTGQMVPHYDELMRRPVAEMMIEAVVHVEPAAPLTRVLQLMVNLRSRGFPVIGPDRQLVGMISREDVMRALKEATEEDC